MESLGCACFTAPCRLHTEERVTALAGGGRVAPCEMLGCCMVHNLVPSPLVSNVHELRSKW